MKKLLFALLIICMDVSNVNAQSKYANLQQATEAFRLAMLNGNGEMLDRLTDDSLSYGHSSGKIENKAEFIKSLTSGGSDFVSLDVSNQSIQQYKRAAFIRHTLQADTNDKGVAGKVKLHVLQVWIKKKNSWQLVARQAVKLS